MSGRHRVGSRLALRDGFADEEMYRVKIPDVRWDTFFISFNVESVLVTKKRGGLFYWLKSPTFVSTTNSTSHLSSRSG